MAGGGEEKNAIYSGAMRELASAACVWGIWICALLSLLPFRFARKWKSWNLYLPVAALVLYGLYEVALPPVDMGGRMVVILPLLFFLCLNGMAKVGLLLLLQNRARRRRRHLHDMPQIGPQFLLALGIAMACVAAYGLRGP